MTYTIKMDLELDEDGISSNEEIAEMVKEMCSSTAIEASNIKILDVND